MAHPLVLALFDDSATAARAARALRDMGHPRERVSIVARSHDEEGAIADAAGVSPGAEIEDSRRAGRLGELGAHFIAAIAIALPGIGPIVADGPLAAGLGEAAGHLAGDIAGVLSQAGLSTQEARRWEGRVRAGAFLIGAHTDAQGSSRVAAALTEHGATAVAIGTWSDLND